MYTSDYVFGLGMSSGDALVWSILFTLAAFAGIGYLRGRITKVDKARAILESLGLGLAAAIISYGVGNLLERIIQ